MRIQVDARTNDPLNEDGSAIHALLADLIDYAGLYPPAGLNITSAVRNYLCYSQSKDSFMLGRFVVDINRLPELRDMAGSSIGDLRLSLIASPTTQWDILPVLLREGFLIDSIEVRVEQSSEIEYIGRQMPAGITTYFEIPIFSAESETLDAIPAGARVKLRTGGLVAEAFPPSEAIVNMLQALSIRRISFKATAGLHHPIRSCNPFTYAPDSPTGMMHGFLNLFLAATLLYYGGPIGASNELLHEEDRGSFSISSGAIGWRSFRWTADQIWTVRKEFAISFGSCSFEEPIHDLEGLGWLS
ncbi:MAG TPA: hypothetical protein VK638_58105 [Edaphobacter sp.]|jgi:hypothetical protein|nr:hypothetical protein [Edaphobacter sp.]